MVGKSPRDRVLEVAIAFREVTKLYDNGREPTPEQLLQALNAANVVFRELRAVARRRYRISRANVP